MAVINRGDINPELRKKTATRKRFISSRAIRIHVECVFTAQRSHASLLCRHPVSRR
jgi:hypothetical protein